MESVRYFGELDLEKKKNLRLQLYVGLCIFIIFVQSITIVSQTGNERTTFIPPEITRPFWISNEEASPEYFEQLAQYVNSLALNTTPDTVKASCAQFMTYILPKDHDRFKKKCDVEELRVKRDNASQMFSVREVQIDANTRRVALIGTTMTFIAGNSVSKTSEAYVVQFAHSNGRFYVINHEKVDENDPFGFKKKDLE